MRDMRTTDNRKVYKVARRQYIAGLKGACTFCGPHRGENAQRPIRNWKKFRKTQYRNTNKVGG